MQSHLSKIDTKNDILKNRKSLIENGDNLSNGRESFGTLSNKNGLRRISRQDDGEVK